jgi:hypothetical protein
VNRWELEDHLIEEHLFDDTSELRDAEDEDLERDHAEAHRVRQLIWNPHTHDS